MSCSDVAQAAAPLIVVGSVILLLMLVAAYIYCFKYEQALKWYMARKENLYMYLNQATMVVRSAQLPPLSHSDAPPTFS